TTVWTPPGAFRAHGGMSESPCRVTSCLLWPVMAATVGMMLGRMAAAKAGRGPLAAGSSARVAGWAGATAMAGVWAATLAAAVALVAGLVTALRSTSYRTAPAMAPTRTAATSRTGPTGRRRGGRDRPRRVSAATAAAVSVST